MLDICLTVKDKEIHVLAKFILGEDTPIVSFYLGRSFKVSKISDDNGNEYNPLCEEFNGHSSYFGAIKYTIKSKFPAKEILVEYSGTVNKSRHNIITEDCIALTWNLVWYPRKSVHIQSDNFQIGTVSIHNLENYKIINGIKNEDVWTYKATEEDLNIIAFKDFVEIKYDSSALTYLKRYEDEKSEMYVELINKVVEYYRNLYEFETLPKFDFVILPDTDPCDGYFNKQLIALGGFYKRISNSNKRSLAYGIAQTWCKGADAQSWEAWLDETFAEWSALLFIYDYLGISEFENMINGHRREDLTPIKTTDGKRHWRDVYHSGTLMIYELYRLYGKELVIKLIRIYYSLINKTTENLILAIRDNNLFETADFIENAVYNYEY